MKRLYRRLGVTIGPGQEWKVAVPLATLAATLMVVIVAGVEIGVNAAVYVPMAIVTAIVMAGIPISYMSGSGTDEDDEEP